MVEVPAVTLKSLYERLGEPAAFALVRDIEGAEYAIFERETETLRKVALAIIEIHPREFEKSGKSGPEFLALCKEAGFRLANRKRDVLVLARH